MRYAVKFAYDGTRFEGYPRQPGGRTVEEELIRVLKKTGIIESEKKARFGSASRTDKGVSALGNVIAFDTDFKLKNVVPALNSKAIDIWSWGIAPVPDEFNPRHAKTRWYTYFLPPEHDEKRLKKAAALFVGTHDFRSFTKKPEKDTLRTLDSITVRKRSDFIVLDFKAQGFLWNMVRRIVSALVKVEQRKISQEDVKRALRGEGRFNWGLAPPENLVLMDIDYGFEFEQDGEVMRKLNIGLDKVLFGLCLRQRFFEGLKELVTQRK